MHDVFDCSFSEIAGALGRNETACRQLAARARVHARAARPQGAASTRGSSGPPSTKHERLVSAFVSATRSGDLDGLMRLLVHDARVVSDGGGKVAAALNVIEGADRTARFLVGAARRGWPDGATVRVARVNGLPGLIMEGPDGVIQAVAFEIEDDLVRTVYAVRNPDKLRHLAATSA
jgi:RNA polymerase sigma-70 factor (ECF subfamily)